MARGRAYCSFGEGTAKRRAQCTDHRAVHMASYTCCARSNSHMVSYMEGNHECKAPCMCESKSRDAHIFYNMGNDTVPGNTGYSCQDKHGHIVAAPHKGSCILASLYHFGKSTHLAGCGRTLVLK